MRRGGRVALSLDSISRFFSFTAYGRKKYPILPADKNFAEGEAGRTLLFLPLGGGLSFCRAAAATEKGKSPAARCKQINCAAAAEKGEGGRFTHVTTRCSLTPLPYAASYNKKREEHLKSSFFAQLPPPPSFVPVKAS